MTDREITEWSLEYLIELGMGEMPTAKALRDRLAQPEPEPVAWMKKDRSSIEVSNMSADYMKEQGFDPLYTAPPKREWVGLTDEDMTELDEDGVTFARYIEAKLKEKNGG